MTAISASARFGQKTARKRVFLAIKMLLILAPLPFGCVGGYWRHVFFAILALIGFYAWRQVQKKASKPEPLPHRTDPARDLLYGANLPVKVRKRGAMAWAFRLWAGFFAICLLQLLPLPVAVVDLISPRTVAIVTQLRGEAPAWLSISLVPRETLVFAMEFLVLAVFGMGLTRLRPGWREMTGMVRALGWSAALQVAFGLLRLLSGTSNFFLFFAPWENKRGEFTGTIVNSNHFAFFLELVAPLLLALIVLEFAGRGGKILSRLLDTLEHRPKVVTLILLLVLTVAGVVLSNSRAGITALVVGLMIASLMMVRTRGTGLSRLLPIGIGALALFVMVLAGGQTWRHFKSLEKASPEQISRLRRWQDSIRLAGDFSVAGTGMGTFRWAYFLYDHEAGQWVTHAHNDVLETVTDSGLIGSLLFFGGFIFFSGAVLSKWRRRNRMNVRLFAAGGVAALAAAFFHSLFDFSLRIPANTLALVVIMALTWRAVHYRKAPIKPRSLRDGDFR